jgi:diguanylate cyclase (GGDEF)-like protein
MVYQDLKQQELVLADLLKSLSGRPLSISTEQLELEARSHQPRLELHLYDFRNAQNGPVRELIEAVGRSKTSRRQITFDNQTGLYSLTLVEAAEAPREALLLQFPLNKKLLKILADRYHCNLALYSGDGRFMVSSDDLDQSGSPRPKQPFGQTLTRHFSTIREKGGSYARTLLSPLPLGSNGVLFLATSQSLNELKGLLWTNSWRLLLTIVLSLALAAFIYLRLLLRGLAPLGNLLDTIQQVARGNLASRTRIPPDTHLHELGNSFNQMLGQLEILYQNRLEDEKIAVLNQETLKYNRNLKKKNLEIERVNIQLKEQYEELSALFQVSRSLTSSLDQNLLFEKIFSIFRESLRCDRIVLLLYVPGSDSLEVVKTTGFESKIAKELSFHIGEGISGMVAASMQAIYSADLSQDEPNLKSKGSWVSTGSLLSLPMVFQNKLIGVLNLHHQQTKAFNLVAQQMAQAIADQAAIAIENSRLYEKTRTLSATDDLTGLANRRQFQNYLQREWAQSRRYQGHFSLLMIDIDHFKSYNDTHGHLKGDIALKQVAALLLQNTRGIDLVARFGGEEFILLLPKADKEASLAVAQKLCACIEYEYFNGMELSQPKKKLTVSIGSATFPSDSTEVYELLNLADEALYQAKRNGRNRAVSWSTEINQNKAGGVNLSSPATD